MTTTGPRTSLRPALVGAVRGTVLELGPGDGANLRHYHQDVRLVAVGPGAAARARTSAAAGRLGLSARVLDGRADELALPGPLGAGIPHLAGAAERRCDLEGRTT